VSVDASAATAVSELELYEQMAAMHYGVDGNGKKTE